MDPGTTAGVTRKSLAAAGDSGTLAWARSLTPVSSLGGMYSIGLARGSAAMLS